MFGELVYLLHIKLFPKELCVQVVKFTPITFLFFPSISKIHSIIILITHKVTNIGNVHLLSIDASYSFEVQTRNGYGIACAICCNYLTSTLE